MIITIRFNHIKSRSINLKFLLIATLSILSTVMLPNTSTALTQQQWQANNLSSYDNNMPQSLPETRYNLLNRDGVVVNTNACLSYYRDNDPSTYCTAGQENNNANYHQYITLTTTDNIDNPGASAYRGEDYSHVDLIIYQKNRTNTSINLYTTDRRRNIQAGDPNAQADCSAGINS